MPFRPIPNSGPQAAAIKFSFIIDRVIKDQISKTISDIYYDLQRVTFRLGSSYLFVQIFELEVQRSALTYEKTFNFDDLLANVKTNLQQSFVNGIKSKIFE